VPWKVLNKLCRFAIQAFCRIQPWSKRFGYTHLGKVLGFSPKSHAYQKLTKVVTISETFMPRNHFFYFCFSNANFTKIKSFILIWMQALASMTTILTNNSHWKVQDKIRDLPYECEKKERPKS
jgi:hypothetical protein